MNKIATYYVIAVMYIFILIATAFINIPYVDSYYYWLWSKHLQWSYFDGPPMVAYVIRLSTTIFGNSVFAINFVGLAIVLASCFVIMQIVNLLVSSKYSFIVVVLWLTSYAVTSHRIINLVTYDGLVNLFELTIVMLVLKYIRFRKNYYIYLIGIFAGLALLSKYSGIILIMIVLVYFLCCKELRIIFKQIHVYLAMLLAVVIFSPVLIWNYQHNWMSFIYQLNFHSYNTEHVHNSIVPHMMYYIRRCVLEPAAPLLIILLFLIFRNFGYTTMNIRNIIQKHSSLQFIFWVMLGIFSFWLCMSTSSSIPDRYLLLVQSLFIIIMGIVLLKRHYYKTLFLLIICNALWSVGDIISHSIQLRNPACYSTYIQSGLLQFHSPLIKYITLSHDASNFCYMEIRQK